MNTNARKDLQKYCSPTSLKVTCAYKDRQTPNTAHTYDYVASHLLPPPSPLLRLLLRGFVIGTSIDRVYWFTGWLVGGVVWFLLLVPLALKCKLIGILLNKLA